MNQIGFIEHTHIKNDVPYRVLLPMGTPWNDALEALGEISQQIVNHIKALEEQASKAKEEVPGDPTA